MELNPVDNNLETIPDELLSELDILYTSFNPIVKPKSVAKPKKPRNLFATYIRIMNLILTNSGFALSGTKTIQHTEDVGILAYSLEQLFPTIINYNIYKLTKDQLLLIVTTLKDYITNMTDVKYNELLNTLDLNKVSRTFPQKKKTMALPILENVELIYMNPSVINPYETQPIPKPVVKPVVKPVAKPVKKSLLKKENKIKIQKNIQVIDLQETIPDVIENKKIVIKRKPKTSKKTYSYNDIKNAKTVEEYTKDGYVYKTIQFKDGVIMTLKPQKVIYEDEEPISKKELYRNRLNNMNQDQLEKEYTTVGLGSKGEFPPFNKRQYIYNLMAQFLN